MLNHDGINVQNTAPRKALPLCTGVGDVHSAARGSGARYNDGKPALELVPLRILALLWPEGPATDALECLADWQEGADEDALYRALEAVGNPMMDCARVFDYGRRKYASWNWAKGMAWSIPLGCAARHLERIANGEDLDPESGLPHAGHVACNLVMLITYVRTFPEGDDRPKGLLLAGPK